MHWKEKRPKQKQKRLPKKKLPKGFRQQRPKKIETREAKRGGKIK
tara:strand:+ start:206 stop:340 length:135 start_codon:yes stop_codon:yes gene_type:complete